MKINNTQIGALISNKTQTRPATTSDQAPERVYLTTLLPAWDDPDLTFETETLTSEAEARRCTDYNT